MASDDRTGTGPAATTDRGESQSPESANHEEQDRQGLIPGHRELELAFNRYDAQLAAARQEFVRTVQSYRQAPLERLQARGVAENEDCPLDPSGGCVHDSVPATDCRRVSCPYGREMKFRALARLEHAIIRLRNAARY